MKLYIIIFVSSLLSIFTSPQDVKLKGKYKMEFEKKYNSQNCIITFFKNNSYQRKLTDGQILKGTVAYDEFNVTLNEKSSKFQMDFLKRDIQKDTIFFGTTDLNDKAVDEMALTIYAGKLIKIR